MLESILSPKYEVANIFYCGVFSPRTDYQFFEHIIWSGVQVLIMDKILIIDDSQLQSEALKKILENDYEVTISNTAEDGLANAKSGVYSLILLDIIMPDINGFMILEQLQQTFMTKYIPVILITCLNDEQNEERGLTLGAVDYIIKPFKPLIIKARVDTHIKLFHYQMRFRRQAMYDELTGVANRRNYNGESLKKWREAIRLGLPISICMFDIDKFKLYNDTFGHPAGDKALVAVANTAASFMNRATDFFARYGGEEFIMLLIGDSAEASFTYVKKIRQAIEDLHMPHVPSVAKWVTVSIGGVTVVPREGYVYDTYLKIADNMLYEAKESGRNIVIWSNNGNEEWRG